MAFRNSSAWRLFFCSMTAGSSSCAGAATAAAAAESAAPGAAASACGRGAPVAAPRPLEAVAPAGLRAFSAGCVSAVVCEGEEGAEAGPGAVVLGEGEAAPGRVRRCAAAPACPPCRPPAAAGARLSAPLAPAAPVTAFFVAAPGAALGTPCCLKLISRCMSLIFCSRASTLVGMGEVTGAGAGPSMGGGGSSSSSNAPKSRMNCEKHMSGQRCFAMHGTGAHGLQHSLGARMRLP